MIHAYNENYVDRARITMGSLFEAGLKLMPPEEFTSKFLASRVTTAWESGNPDYLAGKSGEELLAKITTQDSNYGECTFERSVDYWCGYIICNAQWELGCPFSTIFSAVTIEELRQLYPTLHEADISKTMAIIHDRIYPESALKTMRQRRHLSQSQLAAISGVKLRSIKAYEQGDLDISKAQYDTLSKLAQALTCNIQSLIS